MEKDSTFLGTEKIGKLLFQLAVPAITAQLVNMMYNLVDRIFIGHIPVEGTWALTGVGVCMPIILLISAFAALVSMGSAPRASIFMGQGDNDTAEKILGNSFVMLLGVGVILSIVMFIWGENLLMIFGASENTIGYSMSYLRIYVLGTVFVQLTIGLNAFITAQGFAKIGMYSVLIGAVCNIILDPILIFVFDMGVAGAALATVISQAASAAWVIRFLCGKQTVLKLKRENFRLKHEVVLPCIALGLAPFIMQATESLISISFNASLLKYGGDIAVGGMTILTSIMQFSLLPLVGLTQGAQPIISYNYGAKNSQRVKEAFLTLLKCCVAFSTVIWLLVMLIPETFAGIFTSDPELIAFTADAMHIYFAVSFLFGIQLACQQTFIAIGNAKTSLFLAVLRKVILLIPLIYILPMIFTDKIAAVYMAEPIADLIAVSVTATLFIIQFRKIKELGRAETFNPLKNHVSVDYLSSSKKKF
ncbi:MATE family efflux transporter [Acetobacterium sp.]|jgi:putative MATE family efflux protein|uniref:MATE family efflux transporter n=1 Tax=Acetobacterium sp. TaxID=1872094 RepID=UPI000CC73AA7|nr:MATE family efflux transporter [Acetobacterium sp.]MDO9490885.1 MATE family efflux transporter [Acetobacterium sp.]PKM75295.1 MAG: MATE family efflux transporter [Firmicutes bacterium HGW-Firmicutes-17]